MADGLLRLLCISSFNTGLVVEVAKIGWSMHGWTLPCERRCCITYTWA
jgi:hypothetical protein